MTVGSIARPSTVDPTASAVPMHGASAPPPIDMMRDVAEPAHAATARSRGSSAASDTAAVVTPRVFVDPQIHHAADAYARDGMPGLERWMRDSPVEARWILSVSRSHLAEGLRADLATRPAYQGATGGLHAFLDAERIDAQLAAVVQPQIREAVRQTAVGRLDSMIGSLERLPVDELVRALRAAPEGSPLAELRGTLGVRGNEMDGERVEGWQRRALEQLHALRDTVMGQTWMPEELPGSMAQVQRTMGLEQATPGSIAGEAFFRSETAPDALAHGFETGLDVLEVSHGVIEIAAEASHVAAHGGVAALATDAALLASAGGLAAGIGGLAFGYVLHHQIEENRAERTETARALGL